MTQILNHTDSPALALHHDALVIDSLGPQGPSVFSEAQLDALVAAASQGADIFTIMDVAVRIADDPGLFRLRPETAEYWSQWDESGVVASSATMGAFGTRPFTYRAAVRDLAALHAKARLEERFEVISGIDDLHRMKDMGHHGVIPNFQNTDHLEGELANLEVFYNLGIRVIQLTYNSACSVGDGCMEPRQGGLTSFGRDVVAEMNRLGILVDTSHCGRGTTLEAIEVSQKPTAITHSFAEVVHNHPRGKSDEEIRAIGHSGGYFGVLVLPFFISDRPDPGLDVWLRHFEHVVDLAGPEHVGVGTDSGGQMPQPLADVANRAWAPGGPMGMRGGTGVDLGAATKGFETWHEGWPRLTETLLGAGYSEQEVRGFIGGNFARVFAGAVA